MSAHQAQHRIATMARVLGVSKSGYYAWCKRPASARAQEDQRLLRAIRTSHAASDERYGAPKILDDVRDAGFAVGRRRVARLMRQNGIVGVTRRAFVKTTERDAVARPAPDLVQRAFAATERNQLWVADITYVPTWSGFLYLAIVLDVFSRKIVGWAMQTHLRTELVLEALEMAFGLRCEAAGIRPSMGSVGDAYDNAMAESFFATLECELLARRKFRNPSEAKLALFGFIEDWYNPRRRHSSLGNLSPCEFERRTAHGPRTLAPGILPGPRDGGRDRTIRAIALERTVLESAQPSTEPEQHHKGGPVHRQDAGGNRASGDARYPRQVR